MGGNRCISRHVEELNAQRLGEHLSEHSRLKRIADFEQRSASFAAKSEVDRHAHDLKELVASDLSRRRHLIKCLYDKDMEIWTEAVRNMGEDEVERTDRIRSVAERLRGRREAARGKLAEECYARRFREDCDEVRERDSKARLTMAAERRAGDIEVRDRLRYSEEGPRDDNQPQEGGKERETAEREIRATQNLQMKTALDEQVRQLRLEEEMDSSERVKSEREDINRWKVDEMRERVAAGFAALSAKEIGEKMRLDGQIAVQKKQGEKDLERQRDLILLEFALDRERQGEQGVIEKRLRERDVCRRYRSFVDGQANDDAAEEKGVERARLEAMERVWSRRDAEHRERENDRTRLMLNVCESRNEQLKESMKRREEEENELSRVAILNKIECERQGRAEKEKKDVSRSKALNHMEALKSQIDESERRSIQRKDHRYLEDLELKNKQEEYVTKMNNLDVVPKPSYARKHAKWYT